MVTDEFEILVVHDPELLVVGDEVLLEQLVETEIELLVETQIEHLVEQQTELLEVDQSHLEIIEVASQGPPGPVGPVGPTISVGTGSVLKSFRNVSGAPMPRGTPVFSSVPDEVSGAVGGSIGRQVIALCASLTPIENGASGDFLIDGSLICLGSEWEVITGMPGGLVRGSKYFLDLTVPGKLRLQIEKSNAPTGAYLVGVGYALTPTELKLEICSPIRIT